MSNNKDYAEELLQSIDTVISARISALNYDRTIVCTITDDSKREQGQYAVTDGSTTFEAYGEEGKYSNDMQVQVTIPGGDWTSQKVIIGRYVSGDGPITYRSPTSGITNLTGNLIDYDRVLQVTGSKIVRQYARGKGGTLNGKEYEAASAAVFPIRRDAWKAIDRDKLKFLCVKGEFRSWMNQYQFTSGNYGIEIIINDDITFQLDSSKDMFGDVYGFVDYVSQEQAFSIPSDIESIDSISIKFYQKGNFNYRHETEGIIPLPITEQCQLWVRNLQVYIGGPSEETGPHISAKDNNIIYYPNRKNPEDNCKRTVKIVWSEIDSDGQGVELNLNDNDTIEWYIDTKDGQLQRLDSDEYNNKHEIEITCLKDMAYTEVQAIVKRYENTLDKRMTYKSNILRFENYNSKVLSDLQLRINNVYDSDQSSYAKNSYTCYDQYYNVLTVEGESITESDLNRTVQIEWYSQSGTIGKSFFDKAKVEWEIPDSKTMINKIEDETTTEIDAPQQIGVATWNVLGPKLTYTIKDKYSPDNTNNTIVCTITIPSSDGNSSDIVQEIKKELSFSYKYIKDGKDEPPPIIVQDIVDEKIGNPDDPKPGTVYDYIENQISYIEDDVIGNPDDTKQGTVYDYITNQITDIKDSIPTDYITESYLQDPKKYLDQQKTFNLLTNDGSAKGIFKDGDDLYINGSYIATGILRSENWDGKLYYHYTVKENGEDVTKTEGPYSIEEAEEAVNNGKASWDGDWSLQATKGTYWNLNNGQLFAKKMAISALEYDSNNENPKGVYINSHPSSPDNSYLFVGSQKDGNYINYTQNGNMTIQTNDRFVLNAWDKVSDDSNDEQGIYINSKGKTGNTSKPYFRAGNAINNNGSLSGNNLIEVTANKVLIASTEFVLDAWDSDSTTHNSGSGIYLNSNPKWYPKTSSGTISDTKPANPDNYNQDMYLSIGNNDSFLQFNDQNGLNIKSYKFILDAFKDQNGKYSGIYFNSNPSNSNTEYWFVIGEGKKTNGKLDGGQNNFIQMDGKGNFTIQTNDKFELNAWRGSGTSYEGVYLNSEADNNGIYFRAGSGNADIGSEMAHAKNLIQVSTDGVLIAAEKYVLDAWSDDSTTHNNGSGIYLNSNPKWYGTKNGVIIEYNSQEEANDAGASSVGQDMYLSIGNNDSFLQFNDQNGLNIKSYKFILDAFKEQNNKYAGIYFNSNPSNSYEEYWFVIGEGKTDKDGNFDGGQNNFIQMDGNGNFTIQTNSKFVLNAWEKEDPNSSNSSYQGVYLNSEADRNKIYFRAGSATKDIDDNDLTAANLIQVDKDGVKIGAKDFTLNSWVKDQGGIYMSSNPNANSGIYFVIGKPNTAYIRFQETNNTGILTIRGDLLFADGTSPVNQSQLKDLKDAFDNLEIPTTADIQNAANKAVNNNAKVNSALNTVNSVVSNYLNAGNDTTISKDYVISPYIGGGYLYITKSISGKENSVKIDPMGFDQGNIFQIKSNGNTVVSIDTGGNASFSGTITAMGGQIGGWFIDSVNSNTDKDYMGLFYSGVEGNGIGMYCEQRNDTDSLKNPSIWAGYNGNQGINKYKTPYQQGVGWESKTQFYITKGGFLKATSGTISGWTFDNRYFYKNGGNGYAIAFDFYAFDSVYNLDSRVIGIGKFQVKPDKTGAAADWGSDVYFSVDGKGRMIIKDESVWLNKNIQLNINGNEIMFYKNKGTKEEQKVGLSLPLSDFGMPILYLSNNLYLAGYNDTSIVIKAYDLDEKENVAWYATWQTVTIGGVTYKFLGAKNN